MGILFNIFTGTLDFTGGSSSTIYLPTVQSESNLPSGDADGAIRIVKDTDRIYVYDLTGDTWQDSGITIATFSATASAKGISVAIVADGTLTNILRNEVTLHSANATNPGAVDTTTQQFSGNKDFQNNVLVQGQVKANTIDSLTAGATIGIGIADASTINIGRSGSTINLIGSTINQTVTNLNVTDKNITVNKGGAVASGSDAGVEVEENAVITGYSKVSADRVSWRIKSPGATGEFFLSANNNGFSQVIASDVLTTNRTYTLPDITGTVVLTEGTQTINGNKTISGTTNLSALSVSTPLKLDGSKNIISADIDLSTDVTGTLPIVNGGTNSSSALTNDKVMHSSAGSIIESTITSTELGYLSGVTSVLQSQLNGKEPTITVLTVAKGGTNSATTLNNDRIIQSLSGAIVERSAMTNGQLIIGSTGLNPVNANITQGTGISITNGAGSITITNTTIQTGDIQPTAFVGAQSQAVPVNVTGLLFANADVRSFVAEVDVLVSATSSLYRHFTIKGIQRGSDWTMSSESMGDDTLVAFSITTLGQLQYISGTYAGFSSLTIKFYAKVMPI